MMVKAKTKAETLTTSQGWAKNNESKPRPRHLVWGRAETETGKKLPRGLHHWCQLINSVKCCVTWREIYSRDNICSHLDNDHIRWAVHRRVYHWRQTVIPAEQSTAHLGQVRSLILGMSDQLHAETSSASSVLATGVAANSRQDQSAGGRAWSLSDSSQACFSGGASMQLPWTSHPAHSTPADYITCRPDVCVNLSYWRMEPHQLPHQALYARVHGMRPTERPQEAQLPPRDHAMHRVSWNLANCHAAVQKLLTTCTTRPEPSISCHWLTRVTKSCCRQSLTICATNYSGRASELGGIIDLVDQRRPSLSRSERPSFSS